MAGHIVRIGYDIEEFLDPVVPDRCNDPELGKMARIALIAAVADE